jgi:Tol biopolymer transport system component
MKFKNTLLLLTAIPLLYSSCKKDANSNSTTKTNNTNTTGTYLLFDQDPAYPQTNVVSLFTSVYYSGLDGKNLVRVTTPPSDYFDYRATFSPDGKSILFIRKNSEVTDCGAYTVDITGANLKNLVKSTYNVDYAGYSPNGKQIAYAKATNTSSPYNSEIYVANADGSNPVKITTYSTDGDAANVRWADKIYFNTDYNGTYGIYAINPDGTNLKSIVAGVNLLAISADEKHLVYYDGTSLYYSNTDGSDQKLISSDLAVIPTAAAITKDDKQIYFCSTITPMGMYKINIDGTGLTEVLNGPQYEAPYIY